MISWRRRKPSGRVGRRVGDIELTIPNNFRCPISLELMKDPVTLSTGITYDRGSIETWIEGGNITCPITNQVLDSVEPIPNHTLRKMIQNWCVENQDYGIERIPTPRIPISSMEVMQILSKITITSKGGDQFGCRDYVAKIKRSVKESERNKRCILANGTSSVLSAAFESFSKPDSDKNDDVFAEILSALTLLFPLDGKSRATLGSDASIHCLVRLMDGGDLATRRNSVLVLKEIVSSDKQKVISLSETDSSFEALVKLIKEPICPTSKKASLMVIYHIVSFSSHLSNGEIPRKFLQLGIIQILLEAIVDSERSTCERSLGILDGVLNSQEGREEAYNHALTMPVLVKKILRVSHLATEFSVSIVWKLIKNEERENGGVIVEALQVGAFQKLLLLLQVGCGEKTKEKATELLKLLNLFRGRLECVDSMDFKDLIKRSF